MTVIVKREKFKTEIGRKFYDRLIQIADDDEFLLPIMVRNIGDEKKIKFLKFLDESGMTNPDEILDYIFENYPLPD